MDQLDQKKQTESISRVKLFGRKFDNNKLNDLFQTVFQNTQENDKHISFLSSIKIKTTRRCNLDCTFCSRGKKDLENRDKKDPLTTEDFLKIFQDGDVLGAKKIHLTGGEFFLRKDYLEILTLATHFKFKISITTNGTLLNRKNILAMKNFSIASIQFSLDSFSQDYHDRIRGQKGAFKKTIESLSLIREILPQVKRNINMVATRYLYQSQQSALALIKSIRPDNLLLIPLKDYQNPKSDLLPDKNDIQFFNKKIIPEILKLYDDLSADRANLSLYPYIITDNGISFNLNPFPDKEKNKASFSEGKEERSKDFYSHNTCFAPWLHSYIHDNGKVSLCCHRPDNLYMGSIKKEGLKNIFLNAKYQKARNQILGDGFMRCISCEMFIKENQFLNHYKKKLNFE